MARQLRYTTFAPGELAARLRELSQKRTFEEKTEALESKEAQSIEASTEEQADERL